MEGIKLNLRCPACDHKIDFDVLIDKPKSKPVNEWCDGNDLKGNDASCGALHVSDGYSHDEDFASHTCKACGEYTPSCNAHISRLCSDCHDEESSRLGSPPRNR